MKTVMNQSHDGGLLKMIRRTDPVTNYGGIGSRRVANSIRGVSKANPMGRFYHSQSNSVFGNIAPYTGY